MTATKLTPKAEAVLHLFNRTHPEDGVSEGLIADECYPVIAGGRAVRMVVNAMQKKGLLTFGLWWDEAGYDLLLTDAGREASAQLTKEER
jgi:hypothetical protein